MMPNPLSTLVQPLLDEAINKNQPAKVSIALKLGADPNFPISTPPLSKACKEGNIALAKLLIDAGANVNQVDHDGDTPLLSALRGTTSSVPGSVKGASKEMIEGKATEVAKAWRPGDKEKESSVDSTTTWVLDGGGNIAEKAGNRGNLRLPETAPEIVSLLVKAGAKVNFSTTKGNVFRQTALMLAAEQASVECVRLLIKAGANVEAFDSQGDTVLMHAAAADAPNVVSVILAAKPDKNAINGAGFTALHLAVQYDRAKTVQILISAGADMTIKNKRGVTPVELAVASRSIAAAKVILASMQTGASEAPSADVSMWFQAPLQKPQEPAEPKNMPAMDAARKRISFRTNPQRGADPQR